MIALATACYLACFQAAAVPAMLRVMRRRSSADLSTWREWLLLAGVAIQFGVMWATGASWYVLVSPLVSAGSLGALLVVVYRHR